MSMNNLEPKFLLDLAQWAVTGLLAAFMWLRRPGEQAGEDAKRLRQHVAVMQRELTQRVVLIEERLQHFPSRVEMVRLEGDINGLKLQMQSQDAMLLNIRAQLMRIEDFLMANVSSRGGRDTTL